MWLAAENGMFLRHTNGKWMTTMPEHLNMEWVDSVKVIKLHLMYTSSSLSIPACNNVDGMLAACF